MTNILLKISIFIAITSKRNLKIYKASYKATPIYIYLLNEMDSYYYHL